MRTKTAARQLKIVLSGGPVFFAAALVLLAPLTHSDSVGLRNGRGRVGPGPNIICCGYVNISNVVVHVASSNLDSNNSVAISFDVSPSGSKTTLSWGLNTTYSGYESGKENLRTNTPAPVPNLNPGTKYNIPLFSTYSEPGVEWISATYAGTFTTPPVPDPQAGYVATGSGSWRGSGPVYGYVVGQGAAPISGADIEANYTSQEGSCGTSVQLTFAVASNDSYLIPIWVSTNYFVTYCTLYNWTASDSGRMTESWNLPGSEQRGQLDNGAENWQTFYLSTNYITSQTQWNNQSGQNGVYNVLAFVDTTNAACELESGLSISTSVSAYVGGTGFTKTQTLNVTSTWPTSFTSTGENLGAAFEYHIHGQYSINPTGGLTAANFYAVGSAAGPYYEYYSGSDPISLSQIPAIGSTSAGYAGPIGVPANSTAPASYSMTSGGTLTNQFGLDASVGLSVGVGVSVSYSIELKFVVAATQSQFVGVTCEVGIHNSSSYQYYEVYALTGQPGATSDQVGMQVHIWQCKSDPNVYGCSPINVP